MKLLQERTCLMLMSFLLLEACASPVGVNYLSTQAAHQNLTAGVLTSGSPSATSNQVLNRLNLRHRFETDPRGVLAELHRSLVQEMTQDRLFALAELSFLYGQRTGKQEYYLASTAYAYALLFPPNESDRLVSSDPRLRLAYDLYNRSLAEAMVMGKPDEYDSEENNQVAFRPGPHALPFGAMDIALEPGGFYWSGYGLHRFLSTAKIEVRGLRNRYRRPGLGAPLAASLHTYAGSQAVSGAKRIPARLKVPLTALLRIEQPRRGLLTGRLSGRLELYSADTATEVEIAGRKEPLEYEPTAALAYTLEDSEVWDFELAGFLSAGLLESFIPKDRAQDGLFFLQPFRHDRIPLVLVHGTASSPARWAELINELDADPRLRNRYQIWLFIYTTGNPIAYSGARLREALQNVMHEMDPQQQHAALQRMVVAGHSQGGLLTKLTAIDSGTRFWDRISSAPFEQVELDPEARELLQSALFVQPLPFVERVVFIATPHRGSFLARGWVLDLAAYFVKLPGGLLRRSFDALVQSKDVQLLQRASKPPTSVHNMSPTNPFIQELANIPVAPEIKAHSIIAVQGDGPPETGTDGVVRYGSAHIDGVRSELVVRSAHSTQSHPDTIEEVRRILLEHIRPGSAPGRDEPTPLGHPRQDSAH